MGEYSKKTGIVALYLGTSQKRKVFLKNADVILEANGEYYFFANFKGLWGPKTIHEHSQFLASLLHNFIISFY